MEECPTMPEAYDTLPSARRPDNGLPDERAERASLMLLRLTDDHGSRLHCMAEALAFLAREREGFAGIEPLASALADHAAALAFGMKEVRAMLDGRAGA
jgi:hypothetical protein